MLCYILRHTIGFEKVSDSISLDQFQHGILRRDGSRFDAGVGLSKKPLLAALRSLGERQLLVVERRREKGKGHVASIYSVQPVKEKMALLSRATSPESAPEKGQKYTNALGEKLPKYKGRAMASWSWAIPRAALLKGGFSPRSVSSLSTTGRSGFFTVVAAAYK